MEALASVREVGEAIPVWLLALDDLLGKIASRQIELAQLDELNGVVRPMRPQGSTESLRHAEGTIVKNDSPVTEEVSSTSPVGHPTETKSPIQSATAIADNGGPAMSGAQKQYLAQQMRRKRKTGSMLSGVSGTPKYRTRSMIIVYYDSAVQEAFEALVRNISYSRNGIRKGKMAARMNVLAASVNPTADKQYGAIGGSGVPRLSYARSSRMRPGEPKTVYDSIDAGLEYSQNLCETGAHQFLRDGDCSIEIGNIRERLGEVMKLAKEETIKQEALAAEAAEKTKEEEQPKEERLESKNSPIETDVPPRDRQPPPPTGIIEVDSDVE